MIQAYEYELNVIASHINTNMNGINILIASCSSMGLKALFKVRTTVIRDILLDASIGIDGIDLRHTSICVLEYSHILPFNYNIYIPLCMALPFTCYGYDLAMCVLQTALELFRR